MLRATCKSLLGRKLRLLMSTFAIVLGVAFVGGSLIFSDTLGRSFTALFASTVGDVVVRPADARRRHWAPSTVTIPASVVDELESVPGAARVDGNVHGVRGLRRRQGQQGRRRPGSAGDRRQLLRRTGGSRAPGSRPDRRGGHRTGPTRSCSTRRPPQRSGYSIGEKVHDRHRPRPGPADPEARRHRSGSPTAARSTARRSRSSTPRRRRTCSSRARTPSPTSG